MNLPDSFYIALCMTVLLVGAVYWVWTQIQYVQRKVNVLENIVYELKQVCEGLGRTQYQTAASPHPQASPASPDIFAATTTASATPNSPPRYPPAPPSVIDEDDDLLHETLQREEEVEQREQEEQVEFDFVQEEPLSLSNDAVDLAPLHQEELFSAPPHVEADNDLQPGGVGSGEVAEVSSLDTMTVKELRRLAAQRGISGAAELPKKKLIAAIKAAPSDAFTLDAHL